ncbi:MAG: nucleotidyltransferase family protein [Parabacteroides sp.]|nr:nucleotidyltransferase family protein [Parabacteroides sp.]
MKSTTEILELLRAYKELSAAKYGLKRLGIFGSVARGEQTEESDVDICYEGDPPSLLTLERIQSELEKLLDSPVDLIRIREHMNSRLKLRILKEGIYV